MSKAWAIIVDACPLCVQVNSLGRCAALCIECRPWHSPGSPHASGWTGAGSAKQVAAGAAGAASLLSLLLALTLQCCQLVAYWQHQAAAAAHSSGVTW